MFSKQLSFTMLSILLLVSCGDSNDSSAQKNQNDNDGFVYFIGQEWSKRRVESVDRFKEPILFKIVSNILSIHHGNNIATGSYLGQAPSGAHLVLTNSHIINSSDQCGNDSQLYFKFRYPMMKQYKCSRVVETFAEVDLALVELKVDHSDKFLKYKSGLKLAKDYDFQDDQLFMTAGFGTHKNKQYELYIDDSEECRLISPSRVQNKLRHFSFPKGVWSIAIACDISIGDSGAPLIDPLTGHIVGLIWSGVYPKVAKRSTFEAIEAILESEPELIWSSYNYAAPVNSIQKAFEKAPPSGRFDLPSMLRRAQLFESLFQ